MVEIFKNIGQVLNENNTVQLPEDYTPTMVANLKIIFSSDIGWCRIVLQYMQKHFDKLAYKYYTGNKEQ